MKTIVALVLWFFCASTSIAQPTYPHHDCETVCDLTCQDLVHQAHDNANLPLNCTNGAPGTGPQANYCDNFYSNKVWHVQTCGNGGIDGTQTGCQAGGHLKCRKADGTLAYPSYDFKCYYNAGKGGLPVQTVDQTRGLCTWPDGSEVVMSCNETGGISFAVPF